MIPGRIPGRELWELEDNLILSNSTNKQGELTIYAGTADEKALSIYSGTTEIFHILATTTTVRLMGGASKPVQIGDAGSTSHSLAANDDLFVSGKLEVDGLIYFDYDVYFYGAVVFNYRNYQYTIAGLTASTTQTQGQGALTRQINEISVCANVNDVVTLPTAVAGLICYVFNNGAQTLQVFPASGDNLGAGVNVSTILAAGKNAMFIAYDVTNWEMTALN